MTITIDTIREAISFYEDKRAGRTVLHRWDVAEIDAEMQERFGFTLTNEDRSRLEVHEFRENPPDSYFAYWKDSATRYSSGPGSNRDRIIRGDTITTWMGDTLGTVESAGTPFRSNFGDERQHVRVKAINGRTYAGYAYLDAGDYVRIKVAK